MTGPDSIRQIKTGYRPAGSVAGLNMETIQARFDSTEPGAVVDAGLAYTAAARILATAEDEFAKAIKYLTDHWRGDAADTALRELRRLEDNARELAARTEQTGRAVQRYGQILAKYRGVTLDAGFIRTGKDDRYAQALMTRLNTRIAETYDALPDQVGLTDTKVSPASTATGRIDGTTGGGAAAPPGLASHGPGGAGTDASGGWHGAGDQHGVGGQPIGGGTQLAGAGPSGPVTGLGPNGLGVGGGAVPGTAAVPGGVVGSPGGTTAFIGPGAGPGRGVAGGRVGLGRSGVIGAGGVLGGAPAGNSDEDERSRDYWLAEDRDTWSGDDEVVSAVVGQEDHRPPPGDEESAADVVDLDGDRDGLVEELDPGVTELSALGDGDVEIVELAAEDGDSGDADEPDYDEIDEFLDEILGDDDLSDHRI